jgi:DNA polymerase delta subunit 1
VFAQHKKGVLPRLVDEFMAQRKRVRAQMKRESDPITLGVLEGRQLALKCLANSSYGFTAAEKAQYGCKQVGALTTYYSRMLINAVKGYVERTLAPATIIYGDTDSVMACWNAPMSVAEGFARGEEAAAAINAAIAVDEIGGHGVSMGGAAALWARKAFAAYGDACPRALEGPGSDRHRMVVENEKLYRHYLLYGKKMYAGLHNTPDGKGGFKEKLDVKGLAIVKRDCSVYIERFGTQLVRDMLYGKAYADLLADMRAFMGQVALGEVPLDQLAMSKSLRLSVKTAAPHLSAYHHMVARGDMDIPSEGARMPYVIVAGAGTVSMRGEHPDYVLANKGKVTIDTVYYLERLVMFLKIVFAHHDRGGDLKRLATFAGEQATAFTRGVASMAGMFSSSAPRPRPLPMPTPLPLARPPKATAKRVTKDAALAAVGVKRAAETRAADASPMPPKRGPLAAFFKPRT